MVPTLGEKGNPVYVVCLKNELFVNRFLTFDNGKVKLSKMVIDFIANLQTRKMFWRKGSSCATTFAKTIFSIHLQDIIFVILAPNT